MVLAGFGKFHRGHTAAPDPWPIRSGEVRLDADAPDEFAPLVPPSLLKRQRIGC